MIKALIFDLGNVLIFHDARRAARRFSKATNVPVEKLWKHFFTSRIEKAYTRGEISTREFFQYAKQVFDSRIDFRTFAHYWNDIFWENRGIHAILRKVSRHYPLYLISNTNELHFNYLRRRFPQIFQYFKKTYPSHLVGRRKPDRRIYWKVLKDLKLRAEETVFIDDVKRFVEGAKKVGMKGIQFRSNTHLGKALQKLGVKL